MKVRLDTIGTLIQTLAIMKAEPMPFKVVYKMTKLLESAEQQMKFYNEQVRNILDLYVEKDEYGNFINDQNNSFKIKEGCVNEANAKYDELNSLMVDLVDVSFELDELENLKFTMEQIHALLPFLKQ